MNSVEIPEIISPGKSLNATDPAKIGEEYPYFSLGQFLLLSHYKKNNLPLFEKQAGKTALFFNNMHWLTWQLNVYNNKPEEIDIHPAKKEDYNLNVEPVNEQKIEQQELPSVAEPVKNNNEEIIAFEPLHTIDYFASQGIKLTDAPLANDKLGKQLKSFTEWLKSMKKIHAEKLPGGDEQTDKNIQNIAEASNIETEVVTEAMAEVLEKQGRKEKAIEMYEKLSLINPSKSAYFAAKINSLKTP